jgi:hypothetical protein
VGDVRYELIAELDLTDATRAVAGELLFECFGVEKARSRAWIHHPPTYRVLAWEGETLVGNEMGSAHRLFHDWYVRWSGQKIVPLTIRGLF